MQHGGEVTCFQSTISPARARVRASTSSRHIWYSPYVELAAPIVIVLGYSKQARTTYRNKKDLKKTCLPPPTRRTVKHPEKNAPHVP